MTAAFVRAGRLLAAVAAREGGDLGRRLRPVRTGDAGLASRPLMAGGEL